MLTLDALPQPVIARVHGIATAAGCQLVSMCDLAVASDTARFAVSGVNLGLFCSTPAVASRAISGASRRWKCCSPANSSMPQTALARGLVNRVVPLDELDAEIEADATPSLAKTPSDQRRASRCSTGSSSNGTGGRLCAAGEAMACNMMAEDAQEGIDAFVDKRSRVERTRLRGGARFAWLDCRPAHRDDHGAGHGTRSLEEGRG